MRIALIAGISPASYLLSRGLVAFDSAGAAVAAPPATPPAGSGAPVAPAASSSVADASRAWVASLTEQQKATPLAAPNEPSDNIDDEREADGAASPKTAVIDPATPAAAGATEAVQELVIAREDGATWDLGSKRWQKADGTFVDGEAPTAEELTALETAKADAKAVADAATASAEKKKIVLAGLEEKGEEPLEIEIDDEVAAERIRRLQNDGLRRKAFQEAKAKVDEERAELNAVSQAIDADPVSFVVGHMTPERQLDVARALLAEHFDALIPDIQQYDDEKQGATARANARMALKDRVAESRDAITESQARQSHAAACMNAAQALVPDGVDADTLNSFMRDVETDLVAAARGKQTVSPQTVPQLIERRLKLYGFGAASTSASSAPAAAPAAPRADPAPASSTAKPVGAKAQAIAARVVTRDQAKAAQNRIKTVQTNRQTAAAAAPPGAGAAPVQVPVIDPKADVRQASKQLRQLGGAGWTRPR